MVKIMLVIDNDSDLHFLEKVLRRLSYEVISLKKGGNLSEQLIDHFPDVVFASTLGRNEKILAALGKIKEARGKPQLVFVRQEKESSALSPKQKEIIDGVLYSPIDPFKLIDLLASTTSVDIRELRKRYNRTLQPERKTVDASDDEANGGEASTPRPQLDEDYFADPSEASGSTHVKGKVKGPDSLSVTGGKGTYGETRVTGLKNTQFNAKVESEQTGESGRVGVTGGKESAPAGTKNPAPKAGTELKFDKERRAISPRSGNKPSQELAETEEMQSQTNKAASTSKGEEAGGTTSNATSGKEEKISLQQNKIASKGQGISLYDAERKKRYDKICEELSASAKRKKSLDVNQLRKKQRQQSDELKESGETKTRRNSFLKTLFTMEVEPHKKKS